MPETENPNRIFAQDLQLEINKSASDTALKLMELSSMPLAYEDAFIKAKKALLSTDVAEELAEAPVPAVDIVDSIHHDYLVCLEDGAKVKLLKQHIKRFKMTPEEYRAKWGLSESYPMVCAEYSERRSKMARTYGLGIRGKK